MAADFSLSKPGCPFSQLLLSLKLIRQLLVLGLCQLDPPIAWIQPAGPCRSACAEELCALPAQEENLVCSWGLHTAAL